MPSNNGIGSLGNGLVALWNEDAQQWQPKDALLWSHDPNPPITLETRGNAADAAGTSTANATSEVTAASQAASFSNSSVTAVGYSTSAGVCAATGGSSNSVRRFTAATFNGTSSQMSLVQNPASLPDTNSMTITCAFKTSNTSIGSQTIYKNGNSLVRASIESNGHLYFNFTGTDFTSELIVNYDPGYDVRDGRWHSFGIGVFTNLSAGSKIVHLIFDGQYVTDFGTGGITDASPTFTIGLSTTVHYLGRSVSGNMFSGELAEFTMDASTFVDFSNAGERAKFFYDDGTPRSMGSNASAAYGFSPAIYFSLLTGEPAYAFGFSRTGNTSSWSASSLTVANGPLPLGLTYAITNSFATGVGSATSTGTGTATGSVGGSINSGDASASATSTASATGTAVRPSTGAAAGTSTPSATSAVTIASLASAAGTSTVAATSQTIKLVTVAASGTSAVAATGASTSASTAAAAGTSIPAATGNALKPATASSAGTSTVTGISQPGSNGAASATSTATATGVTIAASTASASATSTPSATGNSIRAASAAAAGVTTPTATGTGIRTLTATASATSTPTATGAATVASIISATGTSSVTATGVAIKPASASAVAVSTVAANSNTVMASTASATATSTAAATYSSGTKRMLLLGVG